MKWCSEEKGLSTHTINLYKYCLTQFLGFVKHTFPKQDASLYFAWDINLCKRFFAKLKTACRPGSVINYHSSLSNARLFYRLRGNRPSDYLDLTARFVLLSSTAHQERRIYTEKEKVAKSGNERGLLVDLFLKVYHSSELWDQFHQIVRDAADLGVTATQLTFALGLLITVLAVPNCMRAGNMNLLEADSSILALKAAQKTFKKRFPGESLVTAAKKLDREKCEPAV